MAKGSNLLLQGLTGKIGSVVVSKAADGDSIVRSKPTTIRQPNTDAQVQQKKKFGEIVEIGRLNKNIIRAYTKPKKVGVSAFNTFISLNVKGATVGSGPDAEVVYEKLVTVSGGGADVYGLEILTQQSGTDPNKDEVGISWQYDSANPTHNQNDRIGLVIINKKTEVISVIILQDSVTTGLATTEINRPENGEKVIIPFVFFDEDKYGTEINKYILQVPNGTPSVNNR